MSEGGGWPTAVLERAPDLDWERLDLYAGELERWNHSIRLVGPKDRAGIRLQIADALLPFLLLPPEFPLLDLGSGAGLPGIPIAVARPACRVVCLEPQAKRVSFLRHAVRVLGLGSVRVIAAKAEEAARELDLAGAFATVTGRAVADPERFLGMARPFVRPDGRVVVLRGERGAPVLPGWALVGEEGYEGPAGVGPRSAAVYAAEDARGGAMRGERE